jgi:murein DD-endopeptidase MepM/ murein hydrolase activator NlpD
MRRALRVVAPLGLAVAALGLSFWTERLESFSRQPFPLTKTQRFHPAVTLQAATFDEAQVPVGVADVPVEVTLRRGQTLGELLEDFGLDSQESTSVVGAFARHVDVRKLQAGAPVSVYLDQRSKLRGLEFVVGDEGMVTVAARQGQWETRWERFAKTKTLRVVTGQVEDSLSEAVERAGAPSSLTYRLADVLRYDLDFNRDLKTGDRFEVLYEEIQTAGRGRSLGDVLAVTYDNQGKRHEAYRFGGSDGYYDAEGKPLEKMFLRSPLPFTRITSRFSKSRFHPVLKIHRPHYGVDYGAPTGTPVKVTAGGTVTFVGWERGGGKVVKVRHTGGYVSAYLHLSGYAKGLRVGSRVSQGQLIGYVGSTGLSTGPHLDYRVQKNGQWIDPLSLNTVKAEAMTVAEVGRFRSWRDLLRSSLAKGQVPAELTTGMVQALDTGASPLATGAVTAR